MAAFGYDEEHGWGNTNQGGNNNSNKGAWGNTQNNEGWGKKANKKTTKCASKVHPVHRPGDA